MLSALPKALASAIIIHERRVWFLCPAVQWHSIAAAGSTKLASATPCACCYNRPVAATQVPNADDGSQPLAALDLGSNSFHLIVAQYRDSGTQGANGGRLQIVDRHREMVRLAEGLDPDNELSATVADRALACLERLGQRIRHLPRHNVRVVGTNTLRKAHNGWQFIADAERVLGHRVEIVSGREEARLIYLGVSHSLEPASDEESRLVVDIGGGSTELILGRQFQPRLMESLYMGCVGMSAAFFGDGAISAKRFVKAENAARQELEVVQGIYRARGWDIAIGASGTFLAVHQAIFELTGERGITAQGLAALKQHLVDAGQVEAMGLPSVGEERAPVFPGGLAIAAAVVDALGIDAMTVTDGALREGLLHDLLGRLYTQDIREATVTDLQQRYHVDTDHASRVARTAGRLLDLASWRALAKLAEATLASSVGSANGGVETALSGGSAARHLRWAAMLHEIGLDIAHSQYHKHGGYLLDNMDLPGFSQPEQHSLAALVRCHRRKFPMAELRGSPSLVALGIVLRLAVVLHRSRTDAPLPELTVAVAPNSREVELQLPAEWLAANPLTRLDLEQEANYLDVASVGLTLTGR